MKSKTAQLFSVSLLLASSTQAITAIDCDQPIFAKDKSGEKRQYDLSKLDSAHTLWSIDESRPPAVYNTTWTVNICHPLKRQKSKEEDQCPSGTNICGVVRSFNPNDDPDHKHDELENVIPISGSFAHDTGKTSEPKWTRVDAQDSKAKDLQLEVQGGKYGNKNQKAIITFQCDPNRTGNDDVADDSKRRRDEDLPKASEGDLTFLSYGSEDQEGKVFDILRLNWKTKYVCEDYKDDSPKGSQGWGFFTWFILILFLGIAAYLIFGSWLNYNRFGARGWDLLPHGDTLRDIPYLVKDWGRKVVDTVSGPGSRGGYSAV